MAKVSDEQLRHEMHVIEQCGSVDAARKALGMSRSTLRNHVRMADGRDLRSKPVDELALPEFPPDDIPIEKVIDHLSDRFEKTAASYDAHTWFPIKIKDNKPIAFMWWGDPHLDDNGTNWPLIKRYAEVCRTTDGLYGANIGDTTNNWVGNLMRLYADQDTSLKTARRLAEWFMIDSGIRWKIWILGNHDQWGDGSAILAMMAQKHGTQKLVCHDWEASFRLCFPNGVEIKCKAAHDFKGHSQWNNIHGLIKQARMGEEADLYVAGHKHCWAYMKEELADRGGTFPTMIRVRGFKHHDDHARRFGFADEQEGGAIMTIFDPNTTTLSARVRVETDIEAGADYLTWLRGRS